MKSTSILIIDNYDSFTYNLVQYCERITGKSVFVMKNDQIIWEEVLNFDKIIISPGPGIPHEAGDLMKFLKLFIGKIPILGVCLGMQAIAEHFNGKILPCDNVNHGVATNTKILKKNSKLYYNIEDGFQAGRYHSWYVNIDTLKNDLEITSVDPLGVPMSLENEKIAFIWHTISSRKYTNYSWNRFTKKFFIYPK